MICPNCGTENKDDVNQCSFCGQRLASKIPPQNDQTNTTNYGSQQYQHNPDMNNQQAYNQQTGNQQWQQPYGQQPYNQQWQQPQRPSGNGLAIASLVLGIASIFFICLFVYASVGMSIAAIVLGIISLKKCPYASKGMAVTGIIIGGIMLIIAVITIIMAIYLLNSGVYNDLMNEIFQNMDIDTNLSIILKHFL